MFSFNSRSNITRRNVINLLRKVKSRKPRGRGNATFAAFQQHLNREAIYYAAVAG